MKLIFLMFLWFPTTVLLAENNDTVIQAQIQELKTQNEHLKKDLEVATKKFELLESKITYKSETLDDLAKQIKINEENFNKTFDLYFKMLCVGFVLLIVFGIYKGYKIWKIKDDLDEYKTHTFNPISDSIKNAQEILTSNTKILKTEIADYKNEISQLYKKVEDDKKNLLAPLEEKISSLEVRILNAQKRDTETLQTESVSTQIINDAQLSKKSTTQFLE